MAFAKNSRYANMEALEVETRDGRTVKALPIRRLPRPSGIGREAKKDERLDLMAHGQYRDATRFWHIADANDELEAKQLVAEQGREITLPES